MTRPISCDPLESRRLLASTVTTAVARGDGPDVRLVDGTLYVFGTGGGDAITATINRAGRVYVRVGGITNASTAGGLTVDTGAERVETPRLRDVHKIYVDGGAGDDVIRLDALSIPAEVHAGTGNDIVYGGSGDDTLFGDGGDDYLFDGRGSDMLAGGAGNDTLRGRFGPDTLLGQNGDDRMTINDSEGVVNGGRGSGNVATLNGIPDAVGNVNSYTADSLYVPAVGLRRATPSVFAYANGGDLLLTAGLNNYGAGYAFDWDYAAARRGYDVSATPFLVNNDYATSPTVRSYGRTFDLGLVPALDARGLYVTLSAVGTSLFSGFARYGTPVRDPVSGSNLNNAGVNDLYYDDYYGSYYNGLGGSRGLAIEGQTP